MRSAIFIIVATGLLSLVVAETSAEVYVNMLWDENQGGFKVTPLIVDDGMTFDRDYQNAYGALNDLEPGPPFIIQASIQGAGEVSFISGGLDLTNPFDIYVQPSGSHSGRISLAGGINFEGSPLDPIKIEGPWVIQAGLDYQLDGGTMVWSHTRFNCQYDPDNSISVPITISGMGLDADYCFFPNYGAPFTQLMIIINHNDANPRYSVSFTDCEFKNLNFNDGMWRAISLDNLSRVSFERCNFEDVTIREYENGGMVMMYDCGIYSIKKNKSKNNSHSIFVVGNAWAADSAFIRTSDELPIVANDMTVHPDSALAVGRGSVLKFLWSGGIKTEGRLYVDSAVLTSYQDDSYGGNSDFATEPFPILNTWKTDGGRGISILPGGSAEIRRSKILHADGAIQAEGHLVVDSCDIAYCDDFGIYLNSAAADTFRISNTSITRISDNGFAWAGGIALRHFDASTQELAIDNVKIMGNDVDGIYVPSIADQFISIFVRNSVIANNFGYGIYVPSDPHLREFKLVNSIIAGNYYSGVKMADQFYQGLDVHIEGNLILGNGWGPMAGTGNQGLSLPNSPPYVVGNTIAYNGGVGLIYWDVDAIDQTVVANNLFFRNGDYALMKSDAGEHLLAANDFWENGDDELRYQGPSGRIYTVEELQALGGEFATNLHVDPVLVPELFGITDSMVYDDTTWVSKLIDSDGAWSGADLAGRFLCPDTMSPSWHYIVASVADTLFVAGNITDYAAAGSTYRIFDPHLSAASPVIDRGRTGSVTVSHDIDNDARLLDGDEDGSIVVDIGADEYKPAGVEPPIRVLEPSADSLLVAYSWFTIKFIADDSIDRVDIQYNVAYDSANPELNWDPIEANVDASKGKFRWSVPPYVTQSDCRVRVVSSANPTVLGLSEPFAMKHLCLTRLTDSGDLVPYDHTNNSWQFPNDSAHMWPPSSWVDYLTGIDTVTGAAYSTAFDELNAEIWAFPSWPTFVEAFGFNACYFDYWTGPIYKPSALFRWAAIKHEWGGSCLGMAVTNLVAFTDSAAFADRPEVGPFAKLHDLAIDEARRSLINRYYTYQYGKRSIEYTRIGRAQTPRQTLDQIIDMMSRKEASLLDRVLTVCDTSSVNNKGCHTVTPYYIDQISAEDSLWFVSVYDNNRPNDYPGVDIDARNNTWTYAPLGFGGTSLLFLEDSLANYDTLAILTDKRREDVVAASTEGYVEVYVHAGDSIVLQSSHGAAGYSGDSLFNSVPDAMPILSRAADAGRPLGYSVPAGEWTLEAGGAQSDGLRVTAFVDSTIWCVRHGPAEAGATDRMSFDAQSRLVLENPDTSARRYDIDFVLVEFDHERQLTVGNVNLAPSDSILAAVDSTGGLSFENHGAAMTYDIDLKKVSSNGPELFSSKNLNVATGAIHHIQPDWDDVGGPFLTVLIDADADGIFEDTMQVPNDAPTAIEDNPEPALPLRFSLHQNYPNPFNPTTEVSFDLPRATDVNLDVFNLLGQKVTAIYSGHLDAGRHCYTWDASDMASGVYLYRLTAGEYVATRKMVLLK